ncbi:MAG TPA: hypothetical protein DD727_03520, partial [Clostridiales bacterium]|nr:hypothetical protein [Clostridiales bacterium]
MWNRCDLKQTAKQWLKVSYWKAFLVSILIVIAGGGSGGNGLISLPEIAFRIHPDRELKYLSQPVAYRPFSGFRDGIREWFSIQPEHFGGLLVVILFVFIFVMLILLVAAALRIFIGYPLEVGGRRFYIQMDENGANMDDLGYSFVKGHYLAVVRGMLWKDFINLLWYFLFIIPGIVKSYAYRMVPYILADHPGIGARQALAMSSQMTKGHKFKMWVLDLSFIGWYLLGLLALFIGVFFVRPYMDAVYAALYRHLRQ